MHFGLLLQSATCSFLSMEGEHTHIQGFLQLFDNVECSTLSVPSIDTHWSPGKLWAFTCSISVNLRKLSAYLRMECNFFLRACPTWPPKSLYSLVNKLLYYSCAQSNYQTIDHLSGRQWHFWQITLNSWDRLRVWSHLEDHVALLYVMGWCLCALGRRGWGG